VVGGCKGEVVEEGVLVIGRGRSRRGITKEQK
jgi:hypothetical protein